MPSNMARSNYRTGQFYDFVGWLYPLIEPWLRNARRTLVSHINAEPSGKLLEIGVGPGYHLSMYGTHQVTAIDVSARMLERAARNVGTSSINLIRMDGEHLVFPDNAFDSVVLAHVLSVTSNPEKMLAEAHRVLKFGGKLFVLNHESSNPTPRFLKRLLQLSGLMLRLRLDFRLADLHNQKRFTPIQSHRLGRLERCQLTLLQK